MFLNRSLRWLCTCVKGINGFFDWQALALALPERPWLYLALSHVYNSLNWQPFAFIALIAFIGRLYDLEGFISAWALGLAGCVLPFHWLPAQSPYIHFGITREMMMGSTVGLPWDFHATLSGMRDGTINTLTMDNLSGMVTIPSFHACAATVLAWAWWRVPVLRWPMLALNVAMALVAVPIGGHYVIDIIAGVAVGLVAIAAARAIESRRKNAPQYSAIPGEAEMAGPRPVAV